MNILLFLPQKASLYRSSWNAPLVWLMFHVCPSLLLVSVWVFLLSFSSSHCFYFLYTLHGPGYRISICFNETNTLCSRFGETLSFWHEIRISEAVLHRNSGRYCDTYCTSAEHDKLEPPRKGISSKRCWSLSFFLKASSPAQVISRDLKAPSELKEWY